MTDDARDSSASRGSVANDPAEVLCFGWISVDDRMPTYSGVVWVFDGKEVVMSESWAGYGFKSYGASCHRDGRNSKFLHGITHWSKIKKPSPPTGSK